MGELLLNHSVFVAADPSTAFSSFGRTEGTGWIMSARVAELRTGCPVEFAIPFPGAGPEAPHALRGTGRIREVAPWRRIVLDHESPWSGRTTITFAPTTGGTTVRTRSEVTDDAIRWMKQRVGEPENDSAADDTIKIGLMTSLSGESGLFGRPTINCAQLAVEEINNGGGVLGREVKLIHTDEATNAEMAPSALARVLETDGVAAVIGSHTSKTLDSMMPTILGRGLLYLFAPVNEGGPRIGNVFRLGESSRAQLDFAIPKLAQHTGGKRWYLLGNDYSWPRHIARTAHRTIASTGGSTVGELYVPFDRRRFDDVIDAIDASGADLLISSLVGFDSIDFERQFVASGLRRRVATLAPLLEDTTLDHLGTDADGIWSSMSYFGNEAANKDFLVRYVQRWGANSAPPSSISASVYDNMHLWACAAEKAGSVDADSVATALHGASFDGARGKVSVTAEGTLTSDMYLATVARGQFVIDDNKGRRDIG